VLRGGRGEGAGGGDRKRTLEHRSLDSREEAGGGV
jgi:hypothetical protein